MKRKHIFYSLLAILLVARVTSVNVLPVYGKPLVPLKITLVVWGEDPYNPIEAYPGDEGVALTVVVQNLSPNETIKGITANLTLRDSPFTDIYGDNNATTIGEPMIEEPLNPTDEVKPKGFFTLTFNLDIDTNAYPTAYTYNMSVGYSVNRTTEVLEGEPQILPITFILSKIPATMTCSVSPQSVEKGEVIDVSGTIEPVQENATVTLTYKMPNGSSFSSNVITDSDGFYRESYKSEVEGSWSVNASWLGDERHEGDWMKAAFEVRFPVSLTVITSSNRLTGGLDNQFNITLKNSGGVSLSTIDVTLTTPQQSPLIISDNNWFIEFLEPGGSTLITVEIFSPASSIGATYSGSLDLNYRDYYGEDHSYSYPIGIIVIGRIELVAYGEIVNPQPARPGSEMSITATLLNKGNIAAMYVNASIMPNSILGLKAESTAYIGEVEENSPVPFTLTTDVNNNAQNGTYPTTISITYRDDQYIDHSFNVTIYVLVEKGDEGQTDSGDIEGLLGFLSEIGPVLLTLVSATVVIVFLYKRRFSGQPKDQNPLGNTKG